MERTQARKSHWGSKCGVIRFDLDTGNLIYPSEPQTTPSHQSAQSGLSEKMHVSA